MKPFSRRKTWPTCLFPLIPLKLFLVLLWGGEWAHLVFPPTVDAVEIAILKSADISAYNKSQAAFKSSLPPSVTTITEFNLEGDIARGRKFARKLRASNARVVLAIGLKAALAAKLEIIDTPVIFCMVLNPEKYDLFSPNLIGIELNIPLARQLHTIQLILPHIKRVGVIFDPSQTGGLIKEAQHYATQQGMILVDRAVSTEREVPETLRSLLSQIEVLWLLPDKTVLNEESFNFLLSTTLETNVPLIGFSPGLVRSGALASMYIKYEDIGEQAATLAKKILAGAQSPSGHIVPLDGVRISINLKTAEFLHIDIPPDVLRQAEEAF